MPLDISNQEISPARAMGLDGSFTYTPRDTCPCGTSLLNPPGQVEKNLPWGPVRFVQCPACRSWVQSPRLSPESLSRWFDSWEYWEGGPEASGTYLAYQDAETARSLEAEHRYNHLLHRLLPDHGRVLEVGCASGSLLAVLRARGHAVTGVDLSGRMAREARKRYALDVLIKDFMALDFAEHSFDLVVMLGMISNLPDITASLARVRALLAPGGHLLFTFPAADSLVARLYDARHWMFAPSVSTFYSRSCCRKLCHEAGFQTVTMSHDRQRPALGKFLSLAGFPGLNGWLQRTGLSSWCFPGALPVPGVFSVICGNPGPKAAHFAGHVDKTRPRFEKRP